MKSNGRHTVAQIVKNIHKDIASISAKRNKMLVDEYLGKTSDTIEGFNQAKTWGLTKKLCPKKIWA